MLLSKNEYLVNVKTTEHELVIKVVGSCGKKIVSLTKMNVAKINIEHVLGTARNIDRTKLIVGERKRDLDVKEKKGVSADL